MLLDNTPKFYKEMWSLLNSKNFSQSNISLGKPGFRSDSSLNYLDLIKIFKDNDNELKIIYLQRQSPEDSKYLTSLSFSADYLLKNFQARIGQVTHDTREFQNRAIINGYVYALCPITGEILSSNKSIPINQSVCFYRFVGAKVFYLITSNIGAGYPKDALYFPEDDLVIRRETHRYGLQPSHVIILKSILLGHYQEFLAYFSDSKPKKIAIVTGHPNFAHHLWNELSALYRLKQKNALNKLDKIFVDRETLGSITEIFPELPNYKIQYFKNNSPLDEETLSILNNVQPIHPEIISELIENNYFFIHIADTFIHHSLTKQIHQIAKRKANPETIRIIDKFKKECFPIIWISLRTTDRTLINQTQVFIEVINSLTKKFPHLGIVFDGFTFPSDCVLENSRYQPTLSQIDLVSKEKSIVEEIVSSINSHVSIYDNIGSSMFEANLWAHEVDLYLCHFGTLQHKIGWLALKPGIVHSNARVSSSKNSQLRCYKVREFGIPPKFFAPSDIRTISVMISENDLRTNVDNYDIDWCIIHEQLIEVITSVQKAMTWEGKLFSTFDFVRKYLRSKLSKMPYVKRYSHRINF